MTTLRETVAATAALIKGLDAAVLTASHEIQGHYVTGVHALLHVVEHFSWHTGQAVWIAKARAGAEHGLAFYDDTQLNSARNIR